MQLRNERRIRVRSVLALSLAMVVLAACNASAGHKGLRGDCPPGTAPAPSGNVVYRPAYPGLRTKPLYLSNYAGAVYPPIARRAPVEPTTAQFAGRRPLFSGWLAGRRTSP